MVVLDFFHDDPVTNFSDPKFDHDTWMKAHNTVSFLLLSYNLQDGHMENCARIKKIIRAHIELC